MRPVAADDSPVSPPEPDAERLPALIADAARGDETAWETIVSLYGRRIYAMAKSRLRDADSAEEITQSVFATLAERLRGEGGAYEERGRFEPWLFRIAMNRVRDEGRRRQRRKGDRLPLEDRSAPPDPRLAGFGDDDEVGALRAAIQRLDEADREIIELRHHGRCSFAQIADLLGEPIGTVLARHHRALRKIRRELEQPGDAEEA